MECVVEDREVVSSHYLEQLQVTLTREGDDRLARARDDYNTLRFALEGFTSIAAVVLLTFFVRSAFLAEGWNCLALALAGPLLGMAYRVIHLGLLRHYNRRFYELVPEDLRWCFRRSYGRQ